MAVAASRLGVDASCLRSDEKTSEVGTFRFRLLQCAARATRGVSTRGDELARFISVQRPDGVFAKIA